MSGPPTRPTDHKARAAIADDHHRTLFVEAGAGTGKTHALVSRAVAMIASGAITLPGLAAITFTEAAAAELGQRLRRALEDRARHGPEPERARCIEALTHFDDAAVGTLHAFARRLLAERPIEAGLPPEFSVLDPIEADAEFEDAWDRFQEVLLRDRERLPIVERGLLLGLRIADLRALAELFTENDDRLTRGSAPAPAEPRRLPTIDASTLVAELRAALTRRSECRDDGDKLALHLDGLTRVPGDIERAAAVGDLDGLLEYLVDVGTLTCGNHGVAGNWPGGGKTTVKAGLERAETARTDILTRQRHAVALHAMAWVRQFALDTAAERREAGRLRFHDLLVLAAKLLVTHPEVGTAWTARLGAVFVDEFQDTDPLQVEIVSRVVGGAGLGALAPRPGTLVFVGDPKQSIYRFRRADVDLYTRVGDELGAGTVALVENFRSVPGVIDWVNDAFASLIGEGDPLVQVPYTPLHASRIARFDAPAVTVLGGPEDGDAAAVRAREARDVVDIVRRAVGSWPIDDGGVDRAARLGDIAILLPTRAALSALERACAEEDIPTRIEAQSLVHDTAEVRDLMAVLRATDDPTADVAVVAALVSAELGCTFADLIAWRGHGGSWDPTGTVPGGVDPHEPVPRAMAVLAKLHRSSRWRSVSETVLDAVTATDALALGLRSVRPRDHWRRIHFVADQARMYCDGGGTSLRGFVAWMTDQAERGARVAETVLPDSDDDALRILTVHAAKGLEFPITILAGLGGQPQADYPCALWAPDGSVEVRLGTKNAEFATPGYDALHQEHDRRDRAERHRLLYVGATRARDHLVVSLWRTTKDNRSLAAQLADALGCDGGTDFGEDVPADAPEIPSTTPAPPGSHSDDAAAWTRGRRDLVEASARSTVVAATELAHGARDVDIDVDAGTGDRGVDPRRGRGRAGTAVGRAVHAVLQVTDLATGENLGAAARAHARAEGVGRRESDVAALARSVLAASTIREAHAAGARLHREMPVVARVGDVTLEGFVDLLAEYPDGRLVVADYKTDEARTDGELDAALARYEMQGAAYALALETILGRPVDECVFLFARVRGPATERRITDLPGAVERARRACRARETHARH